MRVMIFKQTPTDAEFSEFKLTNFQSNQPILAGIKLSKQ